MKNGLVFGKFMPLHVGHLSLIDFAKRHCDILYLILCYTPNEPISGLTRLEWLKNATDKRRNIVLIPFCYDEYQLANTSVSSVEVSRLWSDTLKKLAYNADILFTSEEYGEYVANFMGIDHILFDKGRNLNPICASDIRRNPVLYWNFIADEAKPYFVKTISILGTESTGKSTLAERLAHHYQTVCVPEIGRDVVERTEDCHFEDLILIAELHAKKIAESLSHARKLLFVDTDLNITKSYASFLFRAKLEVLPWIEQINKADLYLFLEPECPYVQDGTRLDEAQRNALHLSHKKTLDENGIRYVSIGGDWDQRFATACRIIDTTFCVRGDGS